jgi:hypothetical protein
MKERQCGFLGSSSFELEARIRRRDGQYRWFLFRYNPTRDEQGRPTHWYVAGTDIEDRKQAEQRLQDENVALREEIDRAWMFEEIVGTSRSLQTVLFRIRGSNQTTILHFSDLFRRPPRSFRSPQRG